jgi:hypothetical protein
MAGWILVPCLVSLRNEFNELAPDRDKASDGSIGDLRHQQGLSDHSPDDTPGLRTPGSDSDTKPEVHAIDVDDDLRKPGWSMTRALQIIITRHREGRDRRLQNVIYNRRIWSASWGWTARAYGGPSSHTEHAHFSARYTTAQESDTSPWGLIEGDDMTTKAEFLDWLQDKDVRKALALAVLAHDPGLDATGEVPAGGVKNYGDTFKANPTVAPAWSIGRAQIAADLGYQNRTRLDQIMVLLKELTGRDFTDEPGIAAAVLAGLNPAIIAAAIPRELAGQVADELAARLKA